MARVSCKICLDADSDEIEKWGQRALDLELSWRKAAEGAGIGAGRGTTLRNHMEKHVNLAPAVLDPQAQQLEDRIAETCQSLLDQLGQYDPPVQAQYLVVVHNLKQLTKTKAAQGNIIAALKSADEMLKKQAGPSALIAFAFARVPGVKVEEATRVVNESEARLALLPPVEEELSNA